jgi:hypothetical protein
MKEVPMQAVKDFYHKVMAEMASRLGFVYIPVDVIRLVDRLKDFAVSLDAEECPDEDLKAEVRAHMLGILTLNEYLRAGRKFIKE